MLNIWELPSRAMHWLWNALRRYNLLSNASSKMLLSISSQFFSITLALLNDLDNDLSSTNIHIFISSSHPLTSLVGLTVSPFCRLASVLIVWGLRALPLHGHFASRSTSVGTYRNKGSAFAEIDSSLIGHCFCSTCLIPSEKITNTHGRCYRRGTDSSSTQPRCFAFSPS